MRSNTWLLLVFFIVFILVISGHAAETIQPLPFMPKLPKVEKPYKDFVLDFWIDSGDKVSKDVIDKVILGTKDLSAYDEGDTIGLCYLGLLNKNPDKIEIDKTFWGKANFYQKRGLIYHELGHCVCKRGHPVIKKSTFLDFLTWIGIKNNRYSLDDGCPKTIMNPSLLPISCLEGHWSYYVKELFESCDTTAYDFRF
jgi:hypothetical protein